ncbi:MAG: winged helix-turn-helix domain-containing protein [Methanomassiliicoccus sp.]|nr:winged helix-turn-helix domain-containing protein [Methanomassiliicoccus sp.]
MASTTVSPCPSEAAGFKAPEALSGGDIAMKVELDKRSLFALASDTRLDILKNLRSNRRTVSQLADLLAIDKAAVHRHLKKLEEGGFVIRTEDHGFVYYALTWKSRDILDPNDRTKIVILISSALICVLAMVVLVYVASGPPGVAGGSTEKTSYVNDNGPGDTDLVPNAPAKGVDTTIPLLTLGLGTAALAIMAWRQYRRPAQRGGESPSDREAGPGF